MIYEWKSWYKGMTYPAGTPDEHFIESGGSGIYLLPLNAAGDGHRSVFHRVAARCKLIAPVKPPPVRNPDTKAPPRRTPPVKILKDTPVSISTAMAMPTRRGI